jgi:hypothetical protein
MFFMMTHVRPAEDSRSERGSGGPTWEPADGFWGGGQGEVNQMVTDFHRELDLALYANAWIEV